MITQIIKKYLCCHKWYKHYDDTSFSKSETIDHNGEPIHHEFKVHSEILICSECGKIHHLEISNKQ